MSLEIVGSETAFAKIQRSLAAGKWRKAERACEEILSTRDDSQAAFLLGHVYRALGQRVRALEWFQKSINWDPEHADAHFSCAELQTGIGDARAAAGSWIAGIQVNPASIRAHLGLCDSLLALHLYEAALIAARQALLVDSENLDALERIGRAAELAGSRTDAIGAFERFDALHPRSVENLRRLANLYAAEGNPQRSQELISRAIALQPRNAGLRFECSQILARLGNRSAALELLRETIRLKPNFPEAYSNMGVLLRAEGRLEDAEAAYRSACSQNPKLALAWNNLANLYVELVKLEEAQRCYDRAISLLPNYAEAHTGRAMLSLLKGDLGAGWDEYEWRWKQPGKSIPYPERPVWNGSSLEGKTILLHSEQGAGDTIQFIRYAKTLKEQGARVLLHCPSSLRTLLSTLPEVDQVLCGSEPIPAFDEHVPLMSLPRLNGTDLASIPGSVPYLAVPPEMPIPQALSDCKQFRVGLVWAGNPNHHNDRNRSISPQLLGPLLAVKGVTFFSLQVGSIFPQLGGVNPVIDLGPYLSNYAATAQCVANLDLLITVDTSVAHLAGALGAPVWLLLPACNDWRWLIKRTDSPWYPGMRIFRQQPGKGWENILTILTKELIERTRGGDSTNEQKI